jgi:hypothetical protein
MTGSIQAAALAFLRSAVGTHALEIVLFREDLDITRIGRVAS